MANKEMAFLNIGEDTFELVDEKTRDIAEAGQFDTVPTDGAIFYTGTGTPDGYEETSPPSGQGAVINDEEVSEYTVYSSAKTEELISGAGGSGIDYSTEEQDTGLKWIDGKRVFQKTFSGTTNSSAGFNELQSNAETLISAFGYIVSDSSGSQYNFPCFINATSFAALVNSNEHKIGISVSGSHLTNKPYNLTVLYTKTDESLYKNGSLDSNVSLTGFANDTANNVLTYNHSQSTGTSGNRTNLLTFANLDCDYILVKGTIRAYTNDGTTDGTTGAEYVNMSLKAGWNTIDGQNIPVTIDNTNHSFQIDFPVSGLTGGNIIFYDTVDNSDSESTAVNAIIEVDVSEIKAY